MQILKLAIMLSMLNFSPKIRLGMLINVKKNYVTKVRQSSPSSSVLEIFHILKRLKYLYSNGDDYKISLDLHCLQNTSSVANVCGEGAPGPDSGNRLCGLTKTL